MTTKKVWRYDSGGMVRTRRTPEGFLITEGCIAQPGIMLYEQDDGTVIRELVDVDVLNDPVANATLYGKALTIEHPDLDVTPDNWRDLSHGTVGDWNYDAALWTALNVNTRDALDAIATGKIQLSPGYAVRVDDTPGIHPEFGAYDTRQLPGREYNHVALTDEARGGPNLTIRRDSARQVKRVETMATKPTTKPTPTKRKDADGEAPPADTTQQDAGGEPGNDLAALNSKFDKMLMLLERMVPAEDVEDAADADAEDVEDAADMPPGECADKPPADAPPAAPKKDAARSPGRQLAERRQIEAVAARYGIDVQSGDLLDATNDKVKRTIIKAVRPAFKRFDSRDAVDVLFDELSAAPDASTLYGGNDYAPDDVRDLATKRDAATPPAAHAKPVDMRKQYNDRASSK